MELTLTTALTYVAKAGGPKLVDAGKKLLQRNAWSRRLARDAFKGLDRPKLKGDLAEWLRRPETAEMLFSPSAPALLERQPLDDYFVSRSQRWADLAAAERHRRTDVILSRVYDRVIQVHESGWAVKIAHERQMAQGEDIKAAVADVAAAQIAQAAEASEKDLLDLLDNLPPSLHDVLLQRFRAAREGVWRVITAVTDLDMTPQRLLEGWRQATPDWLLDSSYPVLLAAADLAAAYGNGALAARLWERAAADGAPRSDYWLARAALARDELDDPERARRLADQLRSRANDEPLAAIAVAVVDREFERAAALADAWTPSTMSDKIVRASLRHRFAMRVDEGTRVTLETVEVGLAALEEGLGDERYTGLALAKAQMLILRVQLHGSTLRERDLREAQDLALWARSQRRRWRGDAAEATALACEAAFVAHDPVTALRVGTVATDENTSDAAAPDEAADERVRRITAICAAAVGRRELAEQLADGLTDPHFRAYVGALLADAHEEDPTAHWERALETARTDGERLRALLGLAAAGADELPGLEEYRHTDPDVVREIEAAAEVARGRPGDAITNLRNLRTTSYTAALSLAAIYGQVGDVDREAQTLKDAAAQFGDLHLRLAGVSAWLRERRYAEAEAELEAVLVVAPADWPGRGFAARALADLALRDERYDVATDRLRAALAVDPGDDRVRWALTRVLLRRYDAAGAWAAYSDTRPEPTSVEEAHAWIHLNTRYAPGEATVRGCLNLVRRFGPSEQLSAHAFGAILTRERETGEDEPLPDALLADLHAEMESFFEQWPDSPLLRRFSAENIQALIAQMTDMVRPTDEQLQLQRKLGRQLLLGQVPLGVLPAAVRKPYAEIVIKRGVGFLAARHIDPAEQDSMIETAQSAIDRDVVIDTTAAVVLDLLSDDVRRVVLGSVAAVLTPDEVLLDAQQCRDALASRSTAMWAWDARRGQAVMQEFPQEDADQLAADAERLLETVRAFGRRPRPDTRALPDLAENHFLPWTAVLDLAAATETPVWIDDVGLRNVARHAGLRVFSTAALLRVLLNRGAINQGQHEETVRGLLEARVGDWPLHHDHLMEIAEDEGWAPGTVAAILGRPAAWADVRDGLRLFNRLIPIVAAKKPDAVVGWLFAAISGMSLALSNAPATAMNVASMLLGKAVSVVPIGAGTPRLVEATQMALDEAIPDVDTSSLIPGAAQLLRDALASALEPQLAAQYVLAVFAGLEERDRVAVLMAVLLRPPLASD